jgi:hypothetical protein
MVLTDGAPHTVREALEFVARPDVPLSAEDLVIRAIEGRLIGNAIVWSVRSLGTWNFRGGGRLFPLQAV